MKIKASTIVSIISLILSLSSVSIFILLIVGWCLNLSHVISNPSVTLKIVLELVGILVAPLGAILGLFM